MYFIYFIRCGDIGRPIKIGRTSDIEKRISILQTGSPDILYLIGVIPVSSEAQSVSLEGWFHKRFSQHRIIGEWFSGSIRLNKGINEHELSKHNVNWELCKRINNDKFWKLEHYGYDVKKLSKIAELSASIEAN